MSNNLLAFITVVSIITITPGSDTALVIRNTLKRGLRSGIKTALGCASGLLVWGIAASFGIAIIVASSNWLFRIVQLLGSIYLIILGLLMLRDAWKGGNPFQGTAGGNHETQSYGEGLIADLLNPKAAVFFTALLPQFVDPSKDGILLVLLYSSIASLSAFIGLVAYGWMTKDLSQRCGVDRFFRWLDAATGLTLMGIGIRMLMTHHENQ